MNNANNAAAKAAASKKKMMLAVVLVMFFCCVCCCISSVVSGGGLFFASKKKGEPTASPSDASSPSSPSKQYTLRSANTGFNDNGAGNVIYLDRHNVTCNGDGLNRFQLKNDYTDSTNHTMQYEYKCLTGLDTNGISENSTTADVDGDPPHTVYLDRHTVDCNNKPITQFKLDRRIDGEWEGIFYNYKCGKGPTSSNCRDVTTGYNDQGAGNVIYLDRHDVKCNEGEYLSKFRLDADDNDPTGRYRYEYKCCKP